jgi:iron complex transport system substrate-binding protein
MMKKMLFIVLGILFLCGSVYAGEVTNYPITIKNGNRNVVFQSAPERVVTNGDTNIILSSSIQLNFQNSQIRAP